MESAVAGSDEVVPAVVGSSVGTGFFITGIGYDGASFQMTDGMAVLLRMCRLCWGSQRERFRKRRPHNQGEVREVAQEEWEKFPWKRIYEMIDGMPRRVEAVINAE